jgi:hypothetical protein
VWRQKSAWHGLWLASHAKRTLQATRRIEYRDKTAEGIERIRHAKTKHGLYSAAAIAERKRFRDLFKGCRDVLFAAKRVFWERNNIRSGR